MWEYHLWNPTTNQQTIIFGYSLSDAFKRRPSLNPNDWQCIMSDYID